MIVGLGPGDDDLLTRDTVEAIASVPVRFGRTRRHPASAALGEAEFFDDLYESAAEIEEVYSAIVERLVSAALDHGTVLYAVPGSPAVAEHTVALLRADGRIVTDVRPAMSFLDLAWVRLALDPHDAGVSVVDGHRFATESAGRRGPFLVGQCDSPQVLSDIKLSYDEPPTESVVVLRHLGLNDESIRSVAWNDLDRDLVPDHLTSLFIEESGRNVATSMSALTDVVDALRVGCPWDRQQTHRSLQKHLIEEAYELVDAIDGLENNDPSTGSDPVDHLAEELGDVLYQVVLHSAIARQAGWFTLADVAAGIHDKLYRRHPHVFGEASVGSLDELSTQWEASKVAEKGRESIVDGIPADLPALIHAVKAGRKASRAGVDMPWAGRGGSAEGLAPASVDLGSDEEVGALLFELANAVSSEGVDPEGALRRAVGRVVDAVRASGN